MSRKQAPLPQRSSLVASVTRAAPLPLLGAVTSTARSLARSTTDACGRLCIDIRYGMPIFADEILRRKG